MKADIGIFTTKTGIERIIITKENIEILYKNETVQHFGVFMPIIIQEE